MKEQKKNKGKSQALSETKKKNTKAPKASARKEEQIKLTKEELREKKKSSILYRLTPFLLGVFAVILGMFMYFPFITGAAGEKVQEIMKGFFSVSSFFIPVFLLYHAVFLGKDRRNGSSGYRWIFSLILVLFINIIYGLFTMGDEKSFMELYKTGAELSSGGVVGGWLCNVLVPVIGKPLTGFICAVVIIVFACFLFGMTPGEIYRRIFPKNNNTESDKEEKTNEEKDRPSEVVNMRAPKKEKKNEDKTMGTDEHLVYSEESMEENYELLRTDAKARKKNPFFVDIEYDESGENSEPIEGEDLDKMDLHEAEIKNEEEETDLDEVFREKKNEDELIEVDPLTGEVIEPDDEDAPEEDDGIPPFDVDDDESYTKDKISAEKITGIKRKTFDIGLKGEEDVKNVVTRKDIEEEKTLEEQLSDIFRDEDSEKDKKIAERIKNISDEDNESAELELKIDTDDSIDIAKKTITTPEEDNRPEFEKPLPNIEEEKKQEYIFPPLSLLHVPEKRQTESSEEQRETARKLMETLKEFKVSATMRDISNGPAVTRYELQPALGVRVKSIESLSSDIARSLSAKSIRIEAPIPGKDTVGVEIPNKNVSTVYIRSLIDSDGFRNAKSKVTACLGEDITGTPVFCDIAKMPHLLIAGATGTGKSVCINSLIVSILYKAKPDEVKFIMIDPKKVELSIYNGIPHLLVPTVTDPKKAAGALAWAVNEMERRFTLLEEARVRNLAFYNKSIEGDPDKSPLPHIVIIIDELADLMLQAKDEVETSVNRLAAKARAAGMHLVIGTQRPSTDVITGLIKANIPSRIACTVSSMMDSRVILDKGGAEKLLGRGDMLYAPVGEMKNVRVQGCFVSEEEVEAVTDFIKADGYHTYSEEILESIEREAQKCGEKKRGGNSNGPVETVSSSSDFGDDEDPLLYSAIKVAVENNGVATSLLQRKLSVGYGRAAKLMDTMEMMRVIGGPNGSKPRELLITYENYLEMMQNKLS